MKPFDAERNPTTGDATDNDYGEFRVSNNS